MLTIKDSSTKRNNNRTVLGIDLTDNYSQISFFKASSDEPQTASAIIGSEMYNIPTILAKRPGVGQWFYGREAYKYAQNEGIMVDRLIEKSIRGEGVIVEEETYDPIALLALFVKRMMGLVSSYVSTKDITGVMFTVESLDTRMVEVLNKLVAYLGLDNVSVSYLSHVESFYYYMLHQPTELWQYQVMVYEYNDILKTMCFSCAHKTTPEVVTIDEADYSTMQRVEDTEDQALLEERKLRLDETFLHIVEESLEHRDVTTVYLLGDGFKSDWAKDSLKILCRNRRVFQGNNLYSKGACFGMMDRLEPSEISKSHVYLGAEKLKFNIGMKVNRRGTESYLAALDAGSNWFEAQAAFDVILDEGDTIPFIITSVTGGSVEEKSIILDGLPKRPKGTTRLHISMEMTKVDSLEIEIEDLGFGEIIKSSGRAWSQNLVLS